MSDTAARASTEVFDLTPTLDHLRRRITSRPRVMLILGSGLGDLADDFDDPVRIPFGDIPGFAPVTVAGHRGLLVAGTLEGTPCIALQGRYHLYEGHSPAAATVPLRAMAGLGADTLIVSNAAGGVSRKLRPGDLMLLDDHINLMWHNPLSGRQLAGDQRFPDMSEPYDRTLRRLAEDVATDLGIGLAHGVYCALTGPSYETPAEIRMLDRLGADAVGMSTVPEVLVARAMGVRVLGISLITNAAAGLSLERLTHEEVVAAGAEARGRFGALVRGVVARLAGPG